jgi:hypothetical protein
MTINIDLALSEHWRRTGRHDCFTIARPYSELFRVVGTARTDPISTPCVETGLRNMHPFPIPSSSIKGRDYTHYFLLSPSITTPIYTMSEADTAPTKPKPRLRKKPTESSTSLTHEIDSVGRMRAATRILVKLSKSTASAPANLHEMEHSAEIPELGETRAITTGGAPLPVPFSSNISESRSELPTLQTVSSSSLSGVELRASETEYISP